MVPRCLTGWPSPSALVPCRGLGHYPAFLPKSASASDGVFAFLCLLAQLSLLVFLAGSDPSGLLLAVASAVCRASGEPDLLLLPIHHL